MQKHTYLKSSSGFSMVELLMVIVTLGIIGTVALPGFMDLSQEAKVAASRDYLNNIKTAIDIKRQQMILRCNLGPGRWPTATSIIANDVTESGSESALCSMSQLGGDTRESRFLDQSEVEIPINPFNGRNDIVSANFSDLCSLDPAAAGYYYDETTGEIGHPQISTSCTNIFVASGGGSSSSSSIDGGSSSSSSSVDCDHGYNVAGDTLCYNACGVVVSDLLCITSSSSVGEECGDGDSRWDLRWQGFDGPDAVCSNSNCQFQYCSGGSWVDDNMNIGDPSNCGCPCPSGTEWDRNPIMQSVCVPVSSSSSEGGGSLTASCSWSGVAYIISGSCYAQEQGGATQVSALSGIGDCVGSTYGINIGASEASGNVQQYVGADYVQASFNCSGGGSSSDESSSSSECVSGQFSSPNGGAGGWRVVGEECWSYIEDACGNTENYVQAACELCGNCVSSSDSSSSSALACMPSGVLRYASSGCACEEEYHTDMGAGCVSGGSWTGVDLGRCESSGLIAPPECGGSSSSEESSSSESSVSSSCSDTYEFTGSECVYTHYEYASCVVSYTSSVDWAMCGMVSSSSESSSSSEASGGVCYNSCTTGVRDDYPSCYCNDTGNCSGSGGSWDGGNGNCTCPSETSYDGSSCVPN